MLPVGGLGSGLAECAVLILADQEARGDRDIEAFGRRLDSGVVRLADRPVREVMTPRTEVDWIDMTLGEAELRAKLLASPHSRLPVCDGSIDAVVGVVQARDVAAALFRGEALDLARLVRKAPVVVDQIDAMDALDALQLVSQTVTSPIANVVDTNYTVVARMAKEHLPAEDPFDGIHARLRAVAREHLRAR